MGACQSNYNSNLINLLYYLPIVSLLLTIQTNYSFNSNNKYINVVKNCILFIFYLFFLQYIILRFLVKNCKSIKEKEMINRHLKFFVSFPAIIFSFLFVSYFIIYVVIAYFISIKIKIDSIKFSYISGFIISYLVYLLLIDFSIKCSKNEYCEN